MSYFGLWGSAPSEDKADVGSEGAETGSSPGQTVAPPAYLVHGATADAVAVAKGSQTAASDCSFAPDTPEIAPRLLSAGPLVVGPPPADVAGVWQGPVAGQVPLSTPFAALANESSKSLNSISSAVVEGRHEGEEPSQLSSTPSQPTPMEEPEEPTTATVVLDLLAGLFSAKSAEPVKKEEPGEGGSGKKAEEEEEESAPVALYFPFSSVGPPPPPPIPTESSLVTTDEEEESSVDLVGQADAGAGVLEKALDVINAETQKVVPGELSTGGAHQMADIKVDVVSVSSTPEPTTPDNAPAPISVVPPSPDAAHLPAPAVKAAPAVMVPLIRVNTAEKGLPAVALQVVEGAEAEGGDTGSQAASPGTPEASAPHSPFHASVSSAPTFDSMDMSKLGEMVAKDGTAAEELKSSSVGAEADEVRSLPIIRTRSTTELVSTSTPSQGNDLISWLWGAPSAEPPAERGNQGGAEPAAPRPTEEGAREETQETSGGSSPSESPPESVLEEARALPAVGSAATATMETCFANAPLPPLAPRASTSFDEDRNAGGQVGGRGGYLHSGLLRGDGDSREGSLKSCLRSPCGSDNGRSEDEQHMVNGAAGLKRVNSRFKIVRFAEGVVDEEHPLSEKFKRPHHDARLVWMEEPEDVKCGGGALYFESRPGTDCWQRTGLDVARDNAHFLHIPHVYGDFVMSTHVRFMHLNNMDQAGLMIRLNSGCWLKACVTNYPAGTYLLGAVATNNGYSDWSMAEFPADFNEVDLRIRREATTYTVEARRAGKPWTLIRILTLLDDKPGGPVMAGLYAAAPTDKGASAEYKFLTIEPGRLVKTRKVEAIPE